MNTQTPNTTQQQVRHTAHKKTTTINTRTPTQKNKQHTIRNTTQQTRHKNECT